MFVKMPKPEFEIVNRTYSWPLGVLKKKKTKTGHTDHCATLVYLWAWVMVLFQPSYKEH